MSYDFKVLGQVDSVGEFPEGASVLIESQGEVKRCAADGLGGGGYVIDIEVEPQGINAIYESYCVPIDNDTLTQAAEAYKSGSNVVVHLTLNIDPNMSAKMSAGPAIPDVFQGYLQVVGVYDTQFDIDSMGGGWSDFDYMPSMDGPFITFMMRGEEFVLVSRSDYDIAQAYWGSDEV